MTFSFNVNSPAFKGASATPVAATAAPEESQKTGENGALIKPSPAQSDQQQKVRVEAKFASVQHGQGCGHCMAYKIKAFEGTESEVQSQMASAAASQQQQNIADATRDVERHEGIHAGRARGNSLLKVGPEKINHAAIAAMVNGQGGGTLGSVEIQPPDKNASTPEQAKRIAEAFQTMEYAANAGASDASGADKGVAATGAAGYKEMMDKAAQLEQKGGKDDGANKSSLAKNDAPSSKKQQGSFSTSA